MPVYVYISTAIAIFTLFYAFRFEKASKDEELVKKVTMIQFFEFIEESADMADCEWEKFYEYKRHFNVTTVYNKHNRNKRKF